MMPMASGSGDLYLYALWNSYSYGLVECLEKSGKVFILDRIGSGFKSLKMVPWDFFFYILRF